MAPPLGLASAVLNTHASLQLVSLMTRRGGKKKLSLASQMFNIIFYQHLCRFRVYLRCWTSRSHAPPPPFQAVLHAC